MLNPEDVKFCFVKAANSQILMGIKYKDWWFYSYKFLSCDSERVDNKLKEWLEAGKKLEKLRIIVKKDAGFYLCEERKDLTPMYLSVAIFEICQKMWISKKLKKQFHHQSWQISQKYLRGSDAIDWMIENLNISHPDALTLANKCVEQNILSHFLGQRYFLDDEEQLYRPRKVLKIEPKYKSFVLSN